MKCPECKREYDELSLNALCISKYKHCCHCRWIPGGAFEHFEDLLIDHLLKNQQAMIDKLKGEIKRKNNERSNTPAP